MALTVVGGRVGGTVGGARAVYLESVTLKFLCVRGGGGIDSVGLRLRCRVRVGAAEAERRVAGARVAVRVLLACSLSRDAIEASKAASLCALSRSDERIA